MAELPSSAWPDMANRHQGLAWRCTDKLPLIPGHSQRSPVAGVTLWQQPGWSHLNFAAASIVATAKATNATQRMADWLLKWRAKTKRSVSLSVMI